MVVRPPVCDLPGSDVSLEVVSSRQKGQKCCLSRGGEGGDQILGCEERSDTARVGAKIKTHVGVLLTREAFYLELENFGCHFRLQLLPYNQHIAPTPFPTLGEGGGQFIHPQGEHMSKSTRNFFSAKGLLTESNIELEALAAACPNLFAALAGELEDEFGEHVSPARLTFQIKAGRIRASLIPDRAKQGVFMDVSDLSQPFKSVEHALESGLYDVASWEEDKRSPSKKF